MGKNKSKSRKSYEVQPTKRGFLGRFYYKAGMWLTHRMVDLEGVGMENIPTEVPYIIAANHETYVDGMIIASFLPKKHFEVFSSLAAQDLLTEHGPFGHVIMKVGRGIPLNRKGNPARGLIAAKQQVDKGNILLVHPEGTRSVDGRLGEMQDGASFLSIKANVPMLPVFIDGGYEVFNRYMKWPNGHDKENKTKRKVIINFGKPFLPANYKSPKKMTEDLTAWMKNMFRNKKVPRTFPSPTALPQE
ncbi:MAG: lysophospholipid acyltransferase family protein [Fastidiosipilaceae bacterium]|nr:1-acyl-sn-glycerol-3-phosphate acyltransferase [Clostridiaceae bacterium]